VFGVESRQPHPARAAGVEAASENDGSLSLKHAPFSAGSVISLLARSDQLTEAVAALRNRAAAATGATITVLLELNEQSGQLHQAADPTDDQQRQHAWLGKIGDVALVADVLSSGRVRQVALDSGTEPELARRLGTAAAVLAPIIHAGQPLGLLVLGLIRTSAFGLLITDLKIPGMDGLTLIRDARRPVPTLPAIIITAYSTEVSAIEAANLGVAGHLSKPFSIAKILGAVARVLGE